MNERAPNPILHIILFGFILFMGYTIFFGPGPEAPEQKPMKDSIQFSPLPGAEDNSNSLLSPENPEYGSDYRFFAFEDSNNVLHFFHSNPIQNSLVHQKGTTKELADSFSDRERRHMAVPMLSEKHEITALRVFEGDKCFYIVTKKGMAILEQEPRNTEDKASLPEKIKRYKNEDGSLSDSAKIKDKLTLPSKDFPSGTVLDGIFLGDSLYLLMSAQGAQDNIELKLYKQNESSEDEGVSHKVTGYSEEHSFEINSDFTPNWGKVLYFNGQFYFAFLSRQKTDGLPEQVVRIRSFSGDTPEVVAPVPQLVQAPIFYNDGEKISLVTHRVSKKNRKKTCLFSRPVVGIQSPIEFKLNFSSKDFECTVLNSPNALMKIALVNKSRKQTFLFFAFRNKLYGYMGRFPSTHSKATEDKKNFLTIREESEDGKDKENKKEKVFLSGEMAFTEPSNSLAYQVAFDISLSLIGFLSFIIWIRKPAFMRYPAVPPPKNGVMRRVLALLVDVLIVSTIAGTIFAMLFPMEIKSFSSSLGNSVDEIHLFIMENPLLAIKLNALFLGTIILYATISEWCFGKTLGKKLLGLKVIDHFGKKTRILEITRPQSVSPT